MNTTVVRTAGILSYIVIVALLSLLLYRIGSAKAMYGFLVYMGVVYVIGGLAWACCNLSGRCSAAEDKLEQKP